ncbi:MAG: hypothetical protein OEP52_12585, partial [Acidimicrobiia bacterium]|nr:hypothetical protein [Acidimicrobiia bacterium]
QIQDIRRAIAEVRGGGAQVACGLQNAGGVISGDPSELVLTGGTATIYCNAMHTKPATDVVWSVDSISGVTANVTQPTTPSDSVGANPTDVVTIEFTGAAGTLVPERTDDTAGYQVNLVYSDADGSHDVEYPSLALPNSLQGLEDVIKEKLGVGEGFGLSIGDVSGTSVVVLDLNIGRCNDDALCDTTPDDDANAAALTSSINADVDGLGGLVSASSDGDVSVSYNASARLKLGFALSISSPQVYVLPDTGINLSAQFVTDALDFEAAFGPFAIQAGTSLIKDDMGNADPSDDVPGLGVVKLGAQLTVGDAITAPVLIETFLGQIGTYLAPTFGSLPDEDCGSIVTDDPNPGDTTVLTGLGCAAISVGLGVGEASTYVADLGLTVDIVAGEFVITPHIPANLATEFLNAALDIELLLKALPEIIGSVEDGLRATASSAAGNGKIPLIGDALDAGADVAGELRNVAQLIVDNVPPEVYDADTVDGVETALQDFIFLKLNPTGLLRLPDGTGPVTAATDIEVIIDCGGCATGNAGSTLAIADIRVIFSIGQELSTEIPFDLGMDGVPLNLAGSLAPAGSWNYVVDLGLSRTEGPYIGVGDPGGNVRPDEELALTAAIGLGDAATECPATPPTDVFDTADYSATRCLSGQIAFLGVEVADSDVDETALSLELTLDIANDGKSTLGFNNAGDISLEPAVGIDANVDVFFRTGIAGNQSAGFPSVIGTFSLEWGFGLGGPNTPLAIDFDNLFLDVSPLVESFLNPILAEIRRFTGPFQPIVDTLTAPIPVVSDLAALVGQPPVTLLGLMELISGNDLSLIQSIAAFITFVNDPATGSGYFALGDGVGGLGGGFSVKSEGARDAQGPTDAAALIENADTFAGSLLSQTPIGGTGNITAKAAQAPAPTKANLPGTFGVPGLTFPFLDNPSQIFGLLLGEDITLIRYDFGPLEASAGFSYNFPPILIGPVPIAIGVGGSVTVKGRFAVGYDTSGLRKVLSGGSATHLFDGIFI